ncbi:Receptor-type tyrosine-protein phosphatase delta [Stylophora pistillata]|uniref:Receptor-type tyrosine-protein phosphatase delta n=1 Tax=Stylophora pistillata TaxID=50429 RepID=A0A2B4RB88_STYPI|nr:Receptor-type tyrosine-protein phosphatase delta [Stylophora pistillata]
MCEKLNLLRRFAEFYKADCVDLDLGMENGAIPDSGITASSELSANTPAKNGRLNYTLGSSWCARISDTNPYLQVDLQTLHIICAVSTQGNSQEDQWVKNYTIKFSDDGTTWTGYKEGGKIKTFQGNGDRSSEVKHVLYESVRAHYLQILPNAYHGARCIRMEVFGVKQKPVNVALGKATFQSSTFNNTQLGVSGVSEKAVDGNSDTGFKRGSCTHTQQDNPSWWRVDLGSNKVAVSDIFIVNRFSASTVVMARSENYNITLGNDPQVVNNPQCQGLYSFVNFIASAVCFTNPLTTGRYVGISVKEQSLTLCEVEIYLRDNLAFGKQTNQSSEAFSGASSRAVDGISNPDYFANSCTHTKSHPNPWWRVDLGQVEPVSEIYVVNQENFPWFQRQNNFEIRVGTLSDNGGTTNPRCGDKKGYSLPQGKGVSFYCRPVKFGRYVTLRSLKTGSDAFTLCEVEVYSERRACRMQAIGVASNDILPDSSFSASSESTGFEAFKGRLHAVRGWSPDRNNRPDDYLQIDLQYEFLLCAVATQGRSTYDDWTTEYKLQLSFDGSTFVTYTENNVDKIFSGNSGRHDIVKHNLKDMRARFIRFQPVNFKRKKALRVEVYGVLISKVPSQAPSNLTLSASSSTSISASWQLPLAYSRHGSITGFKLSYKKKGFMGSMTVSTINSGITFSGSITGLEKYTEYEFQVLAFTSHGDGPKSSVVVERTTEDVPSQPPSGLTVAASNFTSVLASWQLPPKESRHGIIRGYKLFYRDTNGGVDSTVELLIQDAAIRSTSVTGLQSHTDYEFQVLAFTSVGDGPKSSVKGVETTFGAPGPPPSFNHTLKTPTESQGPMITLSWTSPSLSNGIIRSYTVFYRHSEDPHNVHHQRFGPDVFSHTVDVLGGITYWFEVRAETLHPGKNASLTVDVPEYKPRGGPANVLPAEVNKTTFNISWPLLSRELSNGDIILYNVKEELLSRGTRLKRASLTSKTVNTTNTFILLSGLLLCSQYQVSVRAYTKVGPGPYGPPVELPTTADPGTPWGLSASNVGTTQVRLQWKEPERTPKEDISYTVKYLGTKPYNESFREEGFQDVGSSTSYTMKGLVPGSIYKFQIIVSSVCGLGVSKGFPNRVETEMTAPMAPFLIQWTNVEVSELSVEIDLWPVEQRNGPISAYQVIVLKVCDCYQELSRDFHLKLKDLNRNNDTFYPFYVAAEIKNNPVHDKSWKFKVGDGKSYGAFFNKELTRGESYIVYQRALTNHNSQILEGEVSKIAMISIKPGPQCITQETKGENSESQVLLAAVITLSFIVFLCLVLNGTLIWRLRQAESNKRTSIVDSGTPQVHTGVCQVSEPGVYMELQPKPSDSQSREPPEYQSLQDRRVTPDYYNMEFLEGRSNDKGLVYENME